MKKIRLLLVTVLLLSLTGCLVVLPENCQLVCPEAEPAEQEDLEPVLNWELLLVFLGFILLVIVVLGC